ncbi:MAG: T9SS type A sorting domain-containing protein, partial [Gammaproteobacteria bacterium]|nr:T9SS type A sorting domain-containing protein [Gammaproteobacteria bacterium]
LLSPSGGGYRYSYILKDVAIQSDGKIVVVGYADLTSYPEDVPLIFRLTEDGKLDTTFAKKGIFCNNSTNPIFFGVKTILRFLSVKLQSDGKLVVLGKTNWLSDAYQILLRFHPNGAPDSSFGINGLVVNKLAEMSGHEGDLTILPDGRIVAPFDCFGVARYLTDGRLDTTFNHIGVASVFSGFGAPFSRAMLVQADGKVVVAGYPLFDEPTPFIVARLNSDGTIDNTFAPSGYRAYSWDTGSGGLNDMLLLPDQRIILGGGMPNKLTKCYNLATMRILPNGDSDISYGKNAKLYTAPYGNNEQRASLAKLLLQPSDNKILGLGTSNSSLKPTSSATIVRYNADGKTSVEEQPKNKSESFAINPNPASDWIEIDAQYPIDKVTISNLQGQLLHVWAKPQQNKFDVSSFASGFYLISIQSQNQVNYQKLIIQH